MNLITLVTNCNLLDKSDAPINVQVRAIQERQLLLIWELPEDKGNSRIERYEVAIFDGSLHQIRNVISHCASEQYCIRATISGLTPNYVYTFKVRIFNNILWSDYSNFTKKITTKYEGKCEFIWYMTPWVLVLDTNDIEVTLVIII